MILKLYFLFVIGLHYACSCGIPLDDSWNTGSSSLRQKRQISLNERMNCGTTDVAPPTRTNTTNQVNQLIQLMKDEGIHATIIATSDAHQSEYVSPSDGRREYITGFTGSAGTAIVLADGQRALWTDGRYFLQAENELDCNWILMKQEVDGYPTILEWLKTSLSRNSIVGVDAYLISASKWLEYEKELKEVGIEMRATKSNYVDNITKGTLGQSYYSRQLSLLELKFTGKSWEEKVAEVRIEMKKLGADTMVISALDEIAWLLNLRGGDIPHNPVFKSYAIIDKQNVKLFTDKTITPQLDLHLLINRCDQECVEIHPYQTIKQMVSALSALPEVKKILLPSQIAYTGGINYAIYSAVPEEKVMMVPSPIVKMKARKNPVEFAGMKNAHRKDAIALIDFLSFLEEEIAAGNEWTEMSAAASLRDYRAAQLDFQDLSFSTISAFGSNGAIIHYTPQNSTDTLITDQSLYLLDSGGQYKDGTTDVTRTMHYGTPTDFQIEAYTRVLKGALDLAMATFPKGMKDTRIDILARKSLYDVGLDYNHGTGHGIGMYLYIHESPTQVRAFGKEEHALESGYFFSDEPGYYKDGEFGIRLETILAVVPKETKYKPFKEMFAFEEITLVPFEPKLIDVSLLTHDQCNSLNLYHEKVEKIIGPLLTGQGKSRAYEWMTARTTPFPCYMVSSSTRISAGTFYTLLILLFSALTSCMLR